MKRSSINTNGSDEMPPSGGEGATPKRGGKICNQRIRTKKAGQS
mgnify:FL=1